MMTMMMMMMMTVPFLRALFERDLCLGAPQSEIASPQYLLAPVTCSMKNKNLAPKHQIHIARGSQKI